jgi:predicted Zn-dependent protease with MMP-like domain
MKAEDFDAVVRSAIASIPSNFRSLLQNVVISIQDYPSPDLVDEADDELFGIYMGTPLTERDANDTFMLPDQIVIFQGALEDAFESAEELEDEIRVTVIHEVGHFFGLSEDQIEEALEAPRRTRGN